MKYLKLSLSSIGKNKLTFLLITIEIAVLLLTVNFMVSTISDRQMLTKGYEKILGDNSAFVWDINFTQNKINGLANDMKGSRELILSDITDEYEIHEAVSVYAHLMNADNLIVVSDEIYDNLALPLVSGDYSGAIASFNYPNDNCFGSYNVDYQEKAKDFYLTISGKLTPDTYIPLMRSFSSASDFTTKDLYVDSSELDNFVICRKSDLEEEVLSYCGVYEMGFIIRFPENYDENIAKLKQKAGVQEGKAILENSQKALWEDLADFIPVVVCILLVVIIGTMSISIILNKYNEKRGGVLWICGFSRRQILFAHFVNMLIIFVVAAILSIGAYLIMSLLQIELVVSANLSIANIIATVALSLILILASMIIPAIKSKNTSPVEYLRRAK